MLAKQCEQIANDDEKEERYEVGHESDVSSRRSSGSSLVKAPQTDEPKALVLPDHHSLAVNEDVPVPSPREVFLSRKFTSSSLGGGLAGSASMRPWSEKESILRSRRLRWKIRAQPTPSQRRICERNESEEESVDSNATVNPEEVLFRPFVWGTPWTLARVYHTGLFCISSSAVLGVRLWLQSSPTAYLIHSIVVFLDMVLIHLFTRSVWLSLSGEIVTILAAVAFTFTKETIWELLETTMIAVLCSFHMIGSRNKHKEREEELEAGVENLRQQTVLMMRDEENPQASMRQIHQMSSMLLHDMEAIQAHRQLETTHEGEQEVTSTRSLSTRRGFLKQKNTENYVEDDTFEKLADLQSWFVPPSGTLQQCQRSTRQGRLRVCSENFFEHFLDGSAGV